MAVDPKDPDSVLAFLTGNDDDIDVPAQAVPARPSRRIPTKEPGCRSHLTAELDSEEPARLQIMLAESDERVALLLRRPQVNQPDRESRTYEHNRKLISNNLVEELYEANKQQREQMQQLIDMIMMIKQQQQQPATDRRDRRKR